MCGTSSFLRMVFPGLTAIGVDTHGSVLFGLPDEGKRLLRGLGNSVMPPNLDHRAFDEVHWVTGPEGFLGTRELHRGHAVFAGPSNIAYSATKADQAHQVRLLAAELGEHGIKVNGVNPDGVVQGEAGPSSSPSRFRGGFAAA